MSIIRNYFSIQDNEHYYSHKFEVLLIKSPGDISIELINPKYISFFNEENKNTIHFNNYSLKEENYSYVQSIEIILHEYNILYIPRFWLFKISESPSKLEFFSSHHIFSKLFS